MKNIWKLKKIIKQTDNKFVNLYKMEAEYNKMQVNYEFASRNPEGNLEIRKKIFKPDAVVIIPIVKTKTGELQVVLLKHFRPALFDYIYEFPAGLIDKKDKNIIDCAMRELKEETGLVADSFEVLINKAYSSSGLTDESSCVVIAYITKLKGKQKLDFDEDIEVNFVNIEDLPCFLNKTTKLSLHEGYGLQLIEMMYENGYFKNKFK